MAQPISIMAPSQQGDVRSPIVDMTRGGQNGFMPQPIQWNSRTNYVKQQLRAFLVTPPALFQYATDPQNEIAVLKAMIELLPLKVDGLTQTLSIEHGASTPMGNGGEVLESATGASRSPSKPSYGYGLEILGQSITRYWDEFARLYIMDPQLMTPGIVQNANYINAGSPVITAADQSFTVIYIEPDMTLARPLKVWLSANHQPTGDIGALTGVAERGSSLPTEDITQQFTAYSQFGQGPLMFAAAILTGLKLQDLRPYELVPIIQEIDPSVSATQTGIADVITPSVMPPSYPNAGS